VAAEEVILVENETYGSDRTVIREFDWFVAVLQSEIFDGVGKEEIILTQVC
jgi:hypothetical protein